MKKAIYPDFKLGEELYTVGYECLDRESVIYGPKILKSVVTEIEYKTRIIENTNGQSLPVETKSYRLDDGTFLSEYNLIQRSFLTEKEAIAKYLKDIDTNIEEAKADLEEAQRKLDAFTKLKEQYGLVE